MKKYPVFLVLIFTAYSAFASGPYQVRLDDVKVYTMPDMTDVWATRDLFYGDVISAEDYNDNLVVIIYNDGTEGYVKKDALIEGDNAFARLSTDEKIAGTIYNATSASVVYRKPENGSERVPLQFKRSAVIYDAKRVNKDWMSIPIGGGEWGYLKSEYLNEMSREDKIALFERDNPTPAQHNTANLSTATTPAASGKADAVTEAAPPMGNKINAADYINGVKAGRSIVYVIAIVCALLLCMTIYRFRNGPMKGKALGLYVSTLMILSLLEIWYFYSSGMEQVFWFLTFDNIGRTAVLAVVLLAFTWIQLSAGLNVIDDTVLVKVRKKRKYLWIAAGIAVGMVLSGIYRGIVGETGAVYQFRPDTIVCQLIGQIPVAVLFARNLKKRFRNRKLLFCVCYTLIAGTVISLIMGSMLIFIVLAVFYGLASFKPSPQTPEQREAEEREAAYQKRRRAEEHDRLTDEKNRAGGMDPFEEQRRRENIDNNNY